MADKRDFQVKMWGTLSLDEKLTGDLGNAIEGTQIDGRRSDRLTAGKLSPGNFGFCNNICTQRKCGNVRDHGESWRVSRLPAGSVVAPHVPLTNGR
jgi:hypothetical protein